MAVTGRGTHPLLSTWLALPGQGAGYVAALGTDPAQQGEAIWLDWQFQGTAAGDLSATLGAATLVAAGAVDVQGTASPTLDDASLVSNASVFVAGVLAAMLGDASLDAAPIREAIQATFDRRQTPLPNAQPAGLSAVFAADAHKQAQWKAFLRKNGLPALALPAVVDRLEVALRPVWMQPPAVEPEMHVRMGDALAALGRDIGLTNADVETIERVPAAHVGTLLNPKAG